MAAVDDALSSARSAHYGVIATCVAAMLFAATPDLAAPYRAALRDLEALRRIEWEGVQRQLTIDGADSLGKPEKRWADVLNAANGYHHTVGGSFVAFDSVWKPLPEVPVVSTQSSTVARIIEVGSDGPVTTRRFKLLDGKTLDSIAPSCFPAAGQAKATQSCAISVTVLSDTTYDFEVKELHKVNKSLGHLRMGVDKIPIAGLSMRNWLRAHDPNAQLFATGTDHPAFVPRLATVQKDIGDLTMVQAAGVLAERIAGREQHMSFGGVSVGGDFVTLVGPILLILTLIYLSFQINHLCELAAGNERQICDFAWPLTFRGFPGIATGVVTLIVLPFVAVLLLRLRNDSAAALSSVAGVITLALLVLTVAAGWTCLRARNRLVLRAERKAG